MSFTKINKEDYVNKGVTGLPDQPALPTLEMQRKFDELSTDVIIPKFNELSAELDEEVKNLKEGAEGDLLAAVTDGTAITDITQITSGGMYYSTGDCPNAPMTDGSYFNYFASKNGWLVNIIAVNCSNTVEVFASTNKTEDGSTWVNQGWQRLATETDLDGKIRFYTIDKDHQIGFLWKDGCVVPIIDSTEMSGFAFQSDLNNYLPLAGGTMTGDIMGDVGGIFCRDGNIYMAAGGYNKYLTGILSEITATANAAYARAFRLKDTSGNSIAGVFNNLSNGDIAWGYSWDVKSDAHPNDTQASWHIYEYYRGDGYYNIVKVYCDSGIFVGRWDTSSNTIVWNHDLLTKDDFTVNGTTLTLNWL